MNIIPPNVRNLLLITKSLDYEEKLYKLCLYHIKACQIVLLLTRQPYSNCLALWKSVNIPDHLLGNFIVMQADDIENVIRKMLGLHEWCLLPQLVVLDLHSFLKDLPEKEEDADLNTSAPSKPLMQQISLSIAVLFDYSKFLQKKRELSPALATGCHCKTSSILVLSECCGLNSQVLELLINLYYYDDKTAYNDLEVIQEMLLEQLDEQPIGSGIGD